MLPVHVLLGADEDHVAPDLVQRLGPHAPALAEHPRALDAVAVDAMGGQVELKVVELADHGSLRPAHDQEPLGLPIGDHVGSFPLWLRQSEGMTATKYMALDAA